MNESPTITIKPPSNKLKGPTVNFIEPDFDRNRLMPPSVQSIMPPSLSSSKKQLHVNDVTNLELMIKQFNNIQYEKIVDSDESNATDTSELNDSLEIPIEESEPKFETKNFERILSYLEVFLIVN